MKSFLPPLDLVLFNCHLILIPCSLHAIQDSLTMVEFSDVVLSPVSLPLHAL